MQSSDDVPAADTKSRGDAGLVENPMVCSSMSETLQNFWRSSIEGGRVSPSFGAVTGTV